MGELLTFPGFAAEPDVETMNKEELLRYLEMLREEIAALDAEEPGDMESEAYEDWGEAHEELEDLVDEILDLLDELN